MPFSRDVRYQWGLFKRKISSKSLEPFLRYGQKTSKMPQKWGFSPICDPPRFFFKNRALSLLYPYGALTSCKKLEKSLERSLRYLKTDGRTNGPRTDMGDYIGPSRVNPGSKISHTGKAYREKSHMITYCTKPIQIVSNIAKSVMTQQVCIT